MNDRTVESFPILNEMMEYATDEAVRGKLKPGGWGEATRSTGVRLRPKRAR
jgi:hypothetical protein